MDCNLGRFEPEVISYTFTYFNFLSKTIQSLCYHAIFSSPLKHLRTACNSVFFFIRAFNVLFIGAFVGDARFYLMFTLTTAVYGMPVSICMYHTCWVRRVRIHTAHKFLEAPALTTSTLQRQTDSRLKLQASKRSLPALSRCSLRKDINLHVYSSNWQQSVLGVRRRTQDQNKAKKKRLRDVRPFSPTPMLLTCNREKNVRVCSTCAKHMHAPNHVRQGSLPDWTFSQFQSLNKVYRRFCTA